MNRGERIALGTIGAVAGARAMVSISPSLRFDTDPAIVPEPLAGIGPSGSLLLDAVGALAAALLASSSHRRGHGAPWWALLGLLAVPAFIWSVASPQASFANLWRGGTWLVAALAAAVIASRGEAARTIIAAVLAGTVAALLVRSASQLVVEHPAMVAYYEQTRDSFLAARGWAPDSPAALAYERRLRQSEASAWFGLANVNSGILVAGALLLGALALASRCDRVPKGPGLVCALTATGALIVVFLNGGKGAIAALLICAAVMVLLPRLPRMRTGPTAGRIWGASFCGLACLGLAAALIRGALPDEWAFDDRSMLFRWYYMLGALRIIMHHAWLGVGAGGFQEAFVLWRPPLSPEEAASAHSAWLDWITAFGVGGLGLVALSLGLLQRSARRAVSDSQAPPSSAPVAFDRADLLTAALSSLGGSALAVALTSATDLDAAALGVRLGAAIASILVSTSAATVLAGGERRVISIGLAAAALATLMQGQLDMVFWLPGSVWWGWLMLGVAAAGSRTQERRSCPDRLAAVLVSALACAAFAWLSMASIRAGVQERAVERAARAIERAIQRGEPPPRLLVAEELASAATIVPGNELVWQAAVEQALMATRQMTPDIPSARMAAAERAVDLSVLALMARPGLTTARLHADALYLLMLQRRDAGERLAPPADRTTSEAPLATALDSLRLLEATEEVTRRDPRSTAAWIRLAEVHRLFGDFEGAARAAETALAVDATYRLDPTRMLTDAERTRVERLGQRDSGGGAEGAGPAP